MLRHFDSTSSGISSFPRFGYTFIHSGLFATKTQMEAQRQLLEELDVIEWAVSKRLKRNPSLGEAIGLQVSDPVLTSSSKRSYKETLIQQHELKFFINQYTSGQARAKKGFDNGIVTADVERLKDPKKKYDALLNLIAEIEAEYPAESCPKVTNLTSQYALYLSAPKEDAILRRRKRKHFLAAASAHIDDEVDRMFSASEMYGKYLDLLVFYNMYQSLGCPAVSYIEYLKTFLLFEGSSTNADYIQYSVSLLTYLEEFYKKIHPFQTLEYPATETNLKEELKLEDGVENSNGEVFCSACNKLFSKKTVYDGHLNGKKHKKNVTLKKSSDKLNSTPKPTNPQTQLQHKIKFVCSKLQSILDNTINDHYRRAGLSERERMMEVVAIQGEDSDYTVIDSGSDKDLLDDADVDSLYAKELPLGPDGIPIPLWLYKLQGLHRSHTCEICGNVSYKGRLQFNRHFTLTKHVHGLTCLGISEEDVPLFANISTIAEAEDLWSKIKKSKRKEEEQEEDAIEVEDEEGNIMSQKDYLELKRQGLI